MHQCTLYDRQWCLCMFAVTLHPFITRILIVVDRGSTYLSYHITITDLFKTYVGILPLFRVFLLIFDFGFGFGFDFSFPFFLSSVELFYIKIFIILTQFSFATLSKDLLFPVTYSGTDFFQHQRLLKNFN